MVCVLHECSCVCVCDIKHWSLTGQISWKTDDSNRCTEKKKKNTLKITGAPGAAHWALLTSPTSKPFKTSSQPYISVNVWILKSASLKRINHGGKWKWSNWGIRGEEMIRKENRRRRRKEEEWDAVGTYAMRVQQVSPSMSPAGALSVFTDSFSLAGILTAWEREREEESAMNYQ